MTVGAAAEILAASDGVIVGTNLEIDVSTWNAVDPQRAPRMAEIVRAARAEGKS
jgi:predicted TIM-barrel enzyme